MKSHTRNLTITTPREREIRDITPELEGILKESGIREGLMLVNPMHITASVFVNDAEDGLHQDLMETLERLAPSGRDYHHHRTGETNGDAHLKRQLLGQQVVLAVTEGRLHFGPWERVHYAEFDGRRPKRILVKIIGE